MLKQFLKIRLCQAVLFMAMSCFGYAQGLQDGVSTLTVNLQNEIAPMNPIWAWFGYDEPNYTYMKDWKKLISEI